VHAAALLALTVQSAEADASTLRNSTAPQQTHSHASGRCVLLCCLRGASHRSRKRPARRRCGCRCAARARACPSCPAWRLAAWPRLSPRRPAPSPARSRPARPSPTARWLAASCPPQQSCPSPRPPPRWAGSPATPAPAGRLRGGGEGSERRVVSKRERQRLRMRMCMSRLAAAGRGAQTGSPRRPRRPPPRTPTPPGGSRRPPCAPRG
jgi:hypothetical protein